MSAFQGSGFRVQGLVFRVQSSGFRVQGSRYLDEQEDDQKEEDRVDLQLVVVRPSGVVSGHHWYIHQPSHVYTYQNIYTSNTHMFEFCIHVLEHIYQQKHIYSYIIM